MTCGQVSESLSAYIDEELAQGERPEVGLHLTKCSACRESFASVRRLKHAVARLASREEPPGAVRAHVEALRFGRVGRPSARRGAWIVAAALVLAAILAAVATRSSLSSGERLAENLVSDHLRWQAEAAPAQVASADPQKVKDFFDGRVPFTPVAPRLPDARLTGGRLCKIEGRQAQLLFYTCEGQALSVFVLDRPSGDGRCRESRGRHVCSRRIGELTLVAVGEAQGETLEKLLRDAKL